MEVAKRAISFRREVTQKLPKHTATRGDQQGRLTELEGRQSETREIRMLDAVPPRTVEVAEADLVRARRKGRRRREVVRPLANGHLLPGHFELAQDIVEEDCSQQANAGPLAAQAAAQAESTQLSADAGG